MNKIKKDQEKRAEIFCLPNGLQVVIQEDYRFPLAVMQLYVHAGSAFEKEGEAGMSHLLEHMAFKGGQFKRDMAHYIESVGGSINAATGFDHTVYMLDLPSDHWQLGLKILHGLCFEPFIEKEELDQEKKVVLAELEKNEDSPGRKLFETIQGLVWTGSAYARPIIGYKNVVQEISPEDIQAYMDRIYQPQSMLLVICGRVQTDLVLKEVDRFFGQAQNKGYFPWPKTYAFNQKNMHPQVVINSRPWNKVYIGLGLLTGSLNDPGNVSLEALAYLLAGDRTSRWYQKFKYQKELIDDISITPVFLERSGMLYLQAQTDQDKVAKFWEEIIQDLAGLQMDMFSAKEINRAKLNIEDTMFQTKETLTGLATKLGYFQFFEKSLEAEERYLHQLRYLSLDELTNGLQETFQPEYIQATFLGPEHENISELKLTDQIKQVCSENKGQTEEAKIYFDDSDSLIREIPSAGRLVLLPDQTLPYTAIDLSWPGGDMILNEKDQGLSSIMAKTLMRGTKNFSAPEIQEYLAERVSYLDTYAGRDQFTIVAKFPSRFTKDIFALLKEIIFEPAFLEIELAKSIQEQYAQIQQRKDHPLGLISREVFPFLFKDHPYGYYHLGWPERLSEFKVSDLKKYWRTQVNQPWVLSASGDLDQASITSLAEELGQLPRNSEYKYNQYKIKWSKDKELDLALSQRSQAHILVVFPVPKLGDDSNSGISLMKKVLAGQGGMLFRELRDKQGLGYAVSPMMWRTPLVGFLAFYIGTEPEKKDQALEGFKKIVQDLREIEISQEEIERAKHLLQVEYYRERQSLNSRSSEASDLLIYGLDLEFQQNIIDKAMSLNPSDLLDLARRYLIWEESYKVILMPK